MSGIFGYIQKGEQREDILEPMKVWHEAYGRDGSGTVHLNTIGMGCRLEHCSINTPVGEPILRRGELCAVIDALLYNRDELANDLPGIDLSGLSDQEIVLEMFQKYGAAGLRRINGDFAGAVYDGEKLNLFRDHLGIRPLYWYLDERMAAFATDLRGLLAIPNVDDSLNEEYLYANLAGYWLDESEITDYARINAVRAGCVLTVDRELHAEKRAYWRLGEKKIRLGSFDAYKEKLRELVYDSIRRRLAVFGSNPIGAELSGGLDSTVIDVIIRELGADLHCISWSPTLEQQPLQKQDERIIIEKTCEQFGLNCVYGCEDAYADAFADANAYFQTVEGKYYTPGVYSPFVNSTAKYFSLRQIRCCFSGWGGDEGVSHRSNPFEMLYHGEVFPYLKYHWSTCSGFKKPIQFLYRLYRNVILNWDRFFKPFNFYTANHIPPLDLLQTAFSDIWKNKAKCIPSHFPYDPVTDIVEGGNRGRTEQAAMHGAENGVRFVFPYLDYRVEDFAVSIPRSLYLSKSSNRYIYRQAFREQMVRELCEYSNKSDPGRAAVMEASNWSSEQLKKRVEELTYRLDPAMWDQYIDFEKLKALLKQEAESVPEWPLDLLARCYEIQLLRSRNNVSAEQKRLDKQNL